MSSDAAPLTATPVAGGAAPDGHVVVLSGARTDEARAFHGALEHALSFTTFGGVDWSRTDELRFALAGPPAGTPAADRFVQHFRATFPQLTVTVGLPGDPPECLAVPSEDCAVESFLEVLGDGLLAQGLQPAAAASAAVVPGLAATPVSARHRPVALTPSRDERAALERDLSRRAMQMLNEAGRAGEDTDVASITSRLFAERHEAVMAASARPESQAKAWLERWIVSGVHAQWSRNPWLDDHRALANVRAWWGAQPRAYWMTAFGDPGLGLRVKHLVGLVLDTIEEQGGGRAMVESRDLASRCGVVKSQLLADLKHAQRAGWLADARDADTGPRAALRLRALVPADGELETPDGRHSHPQASTHLGLPCRQGEALLPAYGGERAAVVPGVCGVEGTGHSLGTTPDEVVSQFASDRLLIDRSTRARLQVLAQLDFNKPRSATLLGGSASSLYRHLAWLVGAGLAVKAPDVAGHLAIPRSDLEARLIELSSAAQAKFERRCHELGERYRAEIDADLRRLIRQQVDRLSRPGPSSRSNAPPPCDPTRLVASVPSRKKERVTELVIEMLANGQLRREADGNVRPGVR